MRLAVQGKAQETVALVMAVWQPIQEPILGPFP